MNSSERHYVNGRSLTPPFPDGCESILFGMGCFWGAEKVFWQLPAVHVTAVGYAGGESANPSYEQVCRGDTGHAEVVLVVYRSQETTLEALLKVFWENHNPTQGMRQANDIGSQYRSAIYTTTTSEYASASASQLRYQLALQQQGLGNITTEIRERQFFYYAEPYHQQYLAKNPHGYCNLQSIQKTLYPAFPPN